MLPKGVYMTPDGIEFDTGHGLMPEDYEPFCKMLKKQYHTNRVRLTFIDDRESQHIEMLNDALANISILNLEISTSQFDGVVHPFNFNIIQRAKNITIHNVKFNDTQLRSICEYIISNEWLESLELTYINMSFFNRIKEILTQNSNITNMSLISFYGSTTVTYSELDDLIERNRNICNDARVRQKCVMYSLYYSMRRYNPIIFNKDIIHTILQLVKKHGIKYWKN